MILGEWWQWLIITITGLASFITAITVIIKASKSVKEAADLKLKETARREAVEESNLRQAQYRKDLKSLKETILLTIDTHMCRIVEDNKNLNKILNNFIKEQKDINKIMRRGHLETWKNDIRSVYYNLREFGTISDSEKSYVDKIYHVYKGLDGNSDIDAKYSEICEVYARRTHERYEEAYIKQKQGEDKNG